MFKKFKLTDNLFKKSLGSSLVISGLIISILATIPTNFLPDSFPVFYQKSQTGYVLPAQDDATGPIFNPNFVLAESTFRSTRDFPNADSVQSFLNSQKSPLANYNDNGKRAADIIFEAAKGINSAHTNWSGKMITPKLNPALILTKLETEQSLITLSNYDIVKDPERRMVKAMGYACYDLQACDDVKGGFFNQVTGAAWQLEYNYQIASDSNIKGEPYQVGKTITTLDEKQVYLSNAPTAAFYKYTPHVYWGNYNVWKIITAYGWGTNQQKWSRSELDSLNLKNRFTPVSSTAASTSISFKSVESLLQKDYKLADKSDDILTIQKFLRQEGYYAQDPSGLYGMVTKQALDRYRKEKKITVNTNAIPDSNIDKCPDLLAKNYAFNQISDEIKELQQCLRDRGLFSHPTNTGKYATLTQNAHNRYKQALNKSEKDLTTSTETLSHAKADNTVKSLNSVCDSLYQSEWKSGAVGQTVRQLQQCLIDQKLLNSKVTGRVGPLTLAALQKVKPKVTNIQADGKITTSTSSAKGEYYGFKCSDLKNKFYRIGQRSPEISALQQCMSDDKVFNFRITGLYGYVTDAALVKWKKN